MTATQTTITEGMTPAEAAHLLVKLEEGQQAAWLSTRELSWQSPDYESRFQNAAEIDGVFRDLMRETTDNGMRHPGEPAEEFAERAGSDAWLAKLRQADTGTTANPINQARAGITPEQPGQSQDEAATRLLNDPSTPEGQAYARAFPDAAAARTPELREPDPLPEPDRTPGASHPDPFLASRGWQANKNGIYSRTPEPHPASPREKDLEAGNGTPGDRAGYRSRQGNQATTAELEAPSRTPKTRGARPRVSEHVRSLPPRHRARHLVPPPARTGPAGKGDVMIASAESGQTGLLTRLSAWIGRRQRDLSTRLHAAADERACGYGWQVTQTTGRFGFGARRYRDPRFDHARSARGEDHHDETTPRIRCRPRRRRPAAP